MELVAAAILLSTVLYLVDKNQKWKPFGRVLWRVTKLACVAIAGALAIYLAYSHFAHSTDPNDTAILIIFMVMIIAAVGGWIAEKLGLIASLRAARQSSALVRSSDRSAELTKAARTSQL